MLRSDCTAEGLDVGSMIERLLGGPAVSASSEMWKYGCPKSPVWNDDGLEEEGGENVSSVRYCEHTVDNLAIELVGQHWTSEVISLFLEDWEVGRGGMKLPLVNGTFCAKNEGCVLGELRVDGYPRSLFFAPKNLSGGIVTAAKPLVVLRGFLMR